MKKHLLITYKTALAAFIFGFTIISCEKKGISAEEQPLQVEEIANTNDPAQPLITRPANATVPPTRSIHNFIFDWEHALYMPVVAGQPPVPVPWNDQAIKNYDPGLQNDYKKSDGWELVYNTFSDSVHFNNRLFVLYNKFRGVFRYYWYNPMPGNPSVNSYQSLITELALEGSAGSSPLFNYADQLIVDMNADSRSASIIEPWPIQERGWYITQFELAYDRNTINYNWQQFSLGLTLAFGRMEELSLNNKSAGNKMIFLQKPGLRFSTSRGIAIGSNMQAHVKSVNGLNELSGAFSSSLINNLKQTIFDSTAGNKLNATLAPRLGVVDSKLDLTALFRLDYNLVGVLPVLALAPPGVNNSQVIGLGPLFNEPMGIFYLGAKPVIHYTKEAGPLPEQYTLDVSSVEYVLNPFTQQYADVRNFRQEIVATASGETANFTEAKLYQGKVLKASAPLTVLGVRVSFEVVPKNGSAPITLIKTFKAAIQK